MSPQEVVESMLPCWMLGLAMLFFVKNSKYADLIRVEKAGLIKFAKFLLAITAFRLVYFHFIASPAALESIKHISSYIPWQTIPGVFWEDACNGLAFVVGEQLFRKKKWFKVLRLPILAAMSLSFGLGHSYEGLGAIMTMMLYIPFTMQLGKKYGFGTVMLCHIAYDMITLFSFKLFLGA